MDKIAVLDFGGQYAHLIANRIRKLDVYSEIVDGETSFHDLKTYKGIILSGGPQSVYDKEAIKCDPEILNIGIPILGICYGHQLLAHMQGATVEPVKTKEYGLTEIQVKKKEGIFAGLGDEETVWMSHGDSVTKVPPGYEVIGESKDGAYAAIANFDKNFYGIQFHLEVKHTVSGMTMLDNFLNICEVNRDWEIENYVDEKLETIKKLVGDKKVFMLVSGGVDSTVAFVLINKALGEDRVYGLFVDTGFSRLNERENVVKSLKNIGFPNLHVKDASIEYFEALKGVFDPEKKRKIIGQLFLKVQQKVITELNLNSEEWLLGQGTIYPDTIETGGTKHAATIKTHHNRVAEILELIEQGKIVEPLSQLYKDEVREVGEVLGLPESMVWRHPFPGPGLAVRCLCSEGETYPDNFLAIEENINSSMAKHNLKGRILPIRSVGVQGDFRTYKNPLALIGDADFKSLDKIATDLINQNEAINRVILLLSPKDIETINVEKKYLDRDRIKLLQKADDIVSRFIEKHKLERVIWQFPTVLVPMNVNGQPGESIVLRPVESTEAMTANFYQMDKDLLKSLTSELIELDGVSAVFYDITNKPPGTIEWE